MEILISHLRLGSLLIIFFIFTHKTAKASLQEEELSSLRLEQRCNNQTVQCYNCNSKIDKNCESLSNETTTVSYLKDCHGCCVKVVSGLNWVHRTCSESYGFRPHHYSYHDCDSSSSKKVCFCRRNMCNGSSILRVSTEFYYIILCTIFVFITRLIL